MRISLTCREIALASTPILYHATNVGAAVKILKTGRFELKPAYGTDAETSLSDFPYYLSTTRSRLGAYTLSKMGTSTAIFVLDGTRIGNTYRILPVDYWGTGSLTVEQRTKSDEAEDRVLSRRPFIPCMKYVKEVHAYLGPNAQELKHVCLRRGIPLFYYQSERDLTLMDKRKAVTVPLGKLPDSGTTYVPSEAYRVAKEKTRRKNVIAGWLALYHVKLHGTDSARTATRGRLSEYAKYCLTRLAYTHNGDANRQLKSDMHNAKSAEYDAINGERKNLDALVRILTSRKWSTNDFILHLAAKWKL